MGDFDPSAFRAPGDGTVGVLHDERTPPSAVAACCLSRLDHVGSIDEGVGNSLANKRFRDVDPTCGATLCDRRWQPKPLVAAQAAIQRHLENRQCSLLGQSEARADHDVSEQRVSRGPPTAEVYVQQTLRGVPADSDVAPPTVTGGRNPLDLVPTGSVTIGGCRGRRLASAASRNVSCWPSCPLRNGVGWHVSCAELPGVELVDCCDFPIPCRVLDSRPVGIGASPHQIRDMVSGCDVTPRSFIAVAPQEVQKRSQVSCVAILSVPRAPEHLAGKEEAIEVDVVFERRRHKEWCPLRDRCCLSPLGPVDRF